MTITLGSLFDGIGVFPLAASKCGITPIWASEIVPDAISITKRHFPAMVHLGDITKLDGGKIPAVHVITFGSPCQNLSSIGPRDGLSGAKSSLFYQAIRIIEEMRDASGGLYPAIAVWENVVGAMLLQCLDLSGRRCRLRDSQDHWKTDQLLLFRLLQPGLDYHWSRTAWCCRVCCHIPPRLRPAAHHSSGQSLPAQKYD